MVPEFSNVYDDDVRAAAYASLEFPGTYALAFRDLPEILRRHVNGNKALDFGCGAGRSTRFLRSLGFDVVGVDVSPAMLAQARVRDPGGEYCLAPDGDRIPLPEQKYDLILSAFTFDNIPAREERSKLIRSLKSLLANDGVIVNLVSAPEIYVNEWASFSTRDFPENRTAGSGDRVRIVMLDVGDRRPVEDILWTDEDYQLLYRQAGLVPVETHRPLAKGTDGTLFVTEMSVAPWVIYVLRCSSTELVSATPA